MNIMRASLIATGLLVLSGVAQAGLIVTNLSVTDTEISFDILGDVDVLGTNFQSQMVIGTTNNATNWLNSFNEGATTYSYGAAHTSATINSIYSFDNQFGEAFATFSNSLYALGDIIDMSWSIIGSFNASAFDLSAFAISIGGVNDSNQPYIQPEFNLVDEIVTVPEPSTLALLGLGLLGLGFTRRKSA